MYSKGWDIYVDDQKVESLKINKSFLGTKITSGFHKIKIVYHTPYLKEGTVLSIVSLLILIISELLSKLRKNHLENKRKNDIL